MSRTFTGHRPKPARITRIEAAPMQKTPSAAQARAQRSVDPASAAEAATPKSKEIGGPKGLEPTRYGDWERKGICIDF